jgi:hypothetical protein
MTTSRFNKDRYQRRLVQSEPLKGKLEFLFPGSGLTLPPSESPARALQNALRKTFEYSAKEIPEDASKTKTNFRSDF